MRSKTKRSRFIFGALLLAVVFAGWNSLKPDRFFSDLSMDVPSQFIISHHSPFWLLSMDDQLVLKIPNSQVSRVQKVFATQKNFENISASLPRYWADFRAERREFFPKNCPKRFQSGRFVALDKQHNNYFCDFLFDQDNPNFTYLYFSSISPIN